MTEVLAVPAGGPATMATGSVDTEFVEVAHSARLSRESDGGRRRETGRRCGHTATGADRSHAASGLPDDLPPDLREALSTRSDRWEDPTLQVEDELGQTALLVSEGLMTDRPLHTVAEVHVIQQVASARCAEHWSLDERTGWRLVVRAFHDQTQVGRVSRSGSDLAALLAMIGGGSLSTALVAELAEQLDPGLTGPARTTGGPVRQVCLLPGAAAGFAHEVFGHLLEGPASDGSPWSPGQAADSGMSPELTVVSDPTSPTSWARIASDDEGTPARRCVLIDRGKVRARLLSAGHETSSGSVRRTSWDRPARIRQSHTVIEPSQHRAADLAHGSLVVDGLVRGEVSPVTGQFACLFARSWWGPPEDRVPAGPQWIRGDAIEAGRGVMAVGDQVLEGEGRCGVGGDLVAVSFASPALLLDATAVRIGG